MDSILNIEVSRFDNYDTPYNPVNVNLLSWLQSDEYKDKVAVIRAIEDKKERDELKKILPGITVSGLFSYRAIKHLQKHSGFIAIDIDFKGNENIGNFSELKTPLCNIIHVAYCGLSVSGHGYWCLLPIAYPEKHKLHFKALEDKFKKKYGIQIDKACIDVSRLRGYSYDPEGYFNHNAIVFKKCKEPVIIPKSVKSNFNSGYNSHNKIDIAVKMINEALDGEKHSTLLKAAKLMGGYIATGEVNEDYAIEAMETAIQNRDIDSFEDARKTIKDGIEYGRNSPITSNCRAYSQPEQVKPQQKVNEQPQPFKNAPIPEMKNLEKEERKVIDICEAIPVKMEQPGSWEQEIIELETFFKTASLPDHPIQLYTGVRITDVQLFIKAELTIVKANNGKRGFIPDLERLQDLKQILTK